MTTKPSRPALSGQDTGREDIGGLFATRTTSHLDGANRKAVFHHKTLSLASCRVESLLRGARRAIDASRSRCGRRRPRVSTRDAVSHEVVIYLICLCKIPTELASQNPHACSSGLARVEKTRRTPGHALGYLPGAGSKESSGRCPRSTRDHAIDQTR